MVGTSEAAPSAPSPARKPRRDQEGSQQAQPGVYLRDSESFVFTLRSSRDVLAKLRAVVLWQSMRFDSSSSLLHRNKTMSRFGPKVGRRPVLSMPTPAC